MVRSLYSAVAGLTVHQTRMDVIGNNIANVNTYGFKASRTSFSDIYYQSKKASTGGTAVYAGNNEAAVGYGVEISSIDKDMSTSSFQSSNRVLDLAITNDGFFMVGTVDDLNKINSVAYTRYGNFGVDSDGNLVNTLNQFVLGTANDGKFSSSEMSAKRVKETPMELDTLNVNSLVWRAFRDYTRVDYEDVPNDVKATYTDSSSKDWGWVGYTKQDGRKILVAAGTVDTGTGEVISGVGVIDPTTKIPDTSLMVDQSDPELVLTTTAKGDRTATPPTADTVTASGNTKVSTEVLYYVNGRYVNENGVVYDTDKGVYVDNDGFTYKLTKRPEKVDSPTPEDKVDSENFRVDDDGRRIYTYDYEALDGPYEGTVFRYDPIKREYKSTDGNDIFADMKRGELTYADLDGFSVGANGVMTATYASQIKALARVELGTFDNIEGLEQIGDTQFGESIASGQVKVKSPGSNGAGSLKSSKLEMSNVNLASEFSDMIVTQRGFQANARIVTTSDSMLEELVNLKR